MWSTGFTVIHSLLGSHESEAGQPREIHRLQEGWFLWLLGEIIVRGRNCGVSDWSPQHVGFYIHVYKKPFIESMAVFIVSNGGIMLFLNYSKLQKW